MRQICICFEDSMVRLQNVNSALVRDLFICLILTDGGGW